MKKINKYISELGLNKTKEFILAFVPALFFLIISVVLYFVFLKNIILLISMIIISIIIPLVMLSRYPSMINKLNREREREFIDLMGYYQIYLSHGYNTYVSFEKISILASPWLQDKINEFLYFTLEDKSVEPYISFSKLFNNDSIRQLLISVYQITTNGYIDQFFASFMNANKNLETINESNLKDSFKASLKNIAIWPMITAGIFTVILTFGILQVIGGVISGF